MTIEVKNEIKNYLVTNGGANWWIDEAQFLRERNLPFITWKSVIGKDDKPVFKVVSSTTASLTHLVSADGCIDMWERDEGELTMRLREGWKLAPSERISKLEDVTNGQK